MITNYVKPYVQLGHT